MSSNTKSLSRILRIALEVSGCVAWHELRLVSCYLHLTFNSVKIVLASRGEPLDGNMYIIYAALIFLFFWGGHEKYC